MLNMNSQEFNARIEQAKKASLQAPVIVTEQGSPKHVLLSFDEFHKITSLLNLRYDIEKSANTKTKSVAELLSLNSQHDYDDDLFEQTLQKAYIGLKPAEFD
ncbi:MAG: hypothetical protein KGV46_03615 [Pasteurella sp.]|nr:hypothetical protein [Pasteurella sp.]